MVRLHTSRLLYLNSAVIHLFVHVSCVVTLFLLCVSAAAASAAVSLPLSTLEPMLEVDGDSFSVHTGSLASCSSPALSPYRLFGRNLRVFSNTVHLLSSARWVWYFLISGLGWEPEEHLKQHAWASVQFTVVWLSEPHLAHKILVQLAPSRHNGLIQFAQKSICGYLIMTPVMPKIVMFGASNNLLVIALSKMRTIALRPSSSSTLTKWIEHQYCGWSEVLDSS